MRTKSLVLAAAALTAGLLSASAQVYSLNIVGYVNVTVPANKFAIVSNPLKQTGVDQWSITNVLSSGTIPDSTILYKFSNGAFLDGEVYLEGLGWYPGTSQITNGEAFFLGAPSSGPVTVTFVGEVPTGTQTNGVPAGFSLRGSQVPQALPLGDLTTSQTTTLHFPAADSDTIYFFDVATQAYKDGVVYLDGLGWFDPALGGGPVEGPSPQVGQGFFVQKTVQAPWIRTYNP